MEQTINYKGYTIKIEHDEDCCIHPRRNFENIGQMICFKTKRGWEIGDEHFYEYRTSWDVLEKK